MWRLPRPSRLTSAADGSRLAAEGRCQAIGQAASGKISAATLPEVADQQSRKKKTRRTQQFKESKAGRRHKHPANNLVGVLHRGSGRIGQHEKGKEQDRLKIGGPENLRHLGWIGQKGRKRKEQVVDAQEHQDQGHLIHSVGDEHPRSKEDHQCKWCDVGKRSPPILRGVKEIKHDDQSQPRWIEHVRRLGAKSVLAQDGDRGGTSGFIPRHARAQDHRDEQGRENRAAGELPSIPLQPQDNHVDQAGGGEAGQQPQPKQLDALKWRG